ncbi:MAG: ribonuclease HI [Fretibacterium sp.]|nr:ribonuclease HI [Fretibacterium sp.]
MTGKDRVKNRPRVIIHTDGGASPNPGLGGWAAILTAPSADPLRPRKRREIYGTERDTTNNRMELTAAIRALAALKRSCSVDLYTDSTYLRNAFEKSWLEKWRKNGWKTASKRPVLNQDLWMELWELTQRHRVRWHWVKGHGTDEANLRCDQLVQQAKREFLTSPPDVPTSFSNAPLEPSGEEP